ncbi:mucoidy inhibitor MuiA family protein [Nocardia sp. NPDC127526]|uniref:mucoidy inhibitor MuiA family protein n=1 Tax=Nocardia sp. NPDC127526 TaxID=3345393 RepID=UPI0036352D78
MTTVDAPIVAVVVYPGQARITRRAVVAVEAGAQQVRVGGLPIGLLRDSVRVNGRGDASVVGVDVAMQQHPRSPDATVQELEQRLTAARVALAETADHVAVEDGRAEVLATLGREAGSAFARTVAKGKVDPDRVAGFTDALAEQTAAVLARKRELAAQRLRQDEELRSLERRIAAHRKQRQPDRRMVVVDLEVRSGGEIEIELSYVIDDARWTSSYDIRLRGEQLILTWHAEITQNTGEDWPEGELALSTARPAITAQLPELNPWFLDRMPPPMPPMAVGAPAAYGAPPPAPGGAVMRRAAPTRAEAHEELADFAAAAEPAVEHGAAATTYRPARPVAVPSDGTAHRATVAVIDLAATLDHVTAPVHGPEAFLRATAVNTSEHTLRPGKASVFHESEFVGTTTLEVWAPQEEIELNLGVDDRIRVERDLIKRTAGKAVLGGTTRRELGYRIKVGNYGRRATKVTVLDQIPVSRDDGITVKDVACRPDPKQRTDLGELTWELPLDPSATAEITVGFRVDIARGVELRGWRE